MLLLWPILTYKPKIITSNVDISGQRGSCSFISTRDEQASQTGGLGKIIYQVKPGESVINDQSFAGTTVPHRKQDELWATEEHTDCCFNLFISPSRIEMSNINIILHIFNIVFTRCYITCKETVITTIECPMTLTKLRNLAFSQ